MEHNHDELILKVLTNSNSKPIGKRLHKVYEGKYPNILEYLNNRFPDMIERKEVFIRMRLKIEKRPVCQICGKPVKFKGYYDDPFRIYCSNSCKENSEEKQQKMKQTYFRKYGTTNLQKVKSVIEKKKKTSMKNFGVSYPMQSKIIKDKSKESCIEKYGVEYIQQVEYVKSKIKQTCIVKYGKTSYVATSKCKKLAHSKEAKEKRYNTMKMNCTFNVSKPEEELYLYIKDKFPSVERQYRDKDRYPWNCDFYIPVLDLFLELNGTWTHGKHPYSSTSKDDLHIVECWKKKVEEGHAYYNNAIKTWTIYDVNKRKRAEEEKLNFKEVWSLQEGKDFIDTLHSPTT